MDLSSVQVHWIGGVFFTAVPLLLLLQRLLRWPGQYWAYVLPLLFAGYGLESFADVWVHGLAVPSDYTQESRQHLWQGSALLLAGLVELLVARGALLHWRWKLATPLALAALAIGFLFHTQHGGSEMAMALMLTEHRGFAIALSVAAAARAISVLPLRHVAVLESAWLLPLLVFGLQMLSYREAMPGVAH